MYSLSVKPSFVLHSRGSSSSSPLSWRPKLCPLISYPRKGGATGYSKGRLGLRVSAYDSSESESSSSSSNPNGGDSKAPNGTLVSFSLLS